MTLAEKISEVPELRGICGALCRLHRRPPGTHALTELEKFRYNRNQVRPKPRPA